MPEHHINSTNNRSLRSSKQRQAILEAMSQQKTHLSAEEIYQTVKLIHPSISLGTVYRNLEILSSLGLIDRANFADGKARYELAASGHHHHLVCVKCGEIENIHECPMAQNIEAFMADRNFQPLRHYFEIYGHCAKCK